MASQGSKPKSTGTTTTTAPTITSPVAPEVPSSGQTTASAEIRVVVAHSEKETTEYTVVPMGGGDKAQGYNVTPAHDPNGGFVLDKGAPTPDAAIQEFTGKFDKNAVSITGGGDCYVVVFEEKVLACERTREAALDASQRLAMAGKGKDGEGVGGVTGAVHPATAAVRDTYNAVGTEGTRIIVNRGGLVTLAR